MKTRTLFLALTLLLPLVARADDDDDDDDRREHPGKNERSRPAAPGLLASVQGKEYAKECGSCHLAFPPQMLPARSWSALLGGLSNHFGQNAEVDAVTLKHLRDFLEVTAGPEVSGPAPLRITELRWWRREHDEVSPAVFKRKAILTPANCGACHPGANNGAFGEHQVQIPSANAPAPR